MTGAWMSPNSMRTRSPHTTLPHPSGKGGGLMAPLESIPRLPRDDPRNRCDGCPDLGLAGPRHPLTQAPPRSETGRRTGTGQAQSPSRINAGTRQPAGPLAQRRRDGADDTPGPPRVAPPSLRRPASRPTSPTGTATRFLTDFRSRPRRPGPRALHGRPARRQRAGET